MGRTRPTVNKCSRFNFFQLFIFFGLKKCVIKTANIILKLSRVFVTLFLIFLKYKKYAAVLYGELSVSYHPVLFFRFPIQTDTLSYLVLSEGLNGGRTDRTDKSVLLPDLFSNQKFKKKFHTKFFISETLFLCVITICYFYNLPPKWPKLV